MGEERRRGCCGDRRSAAAAETHPRPHGQSPRPGLDALTPGRGGRASGGGGHCWSSEGSRAPDGRGALARLRRGACGHFTARDAGRRVRVRLLLRPRGRRRSGASRRPGAGGGWGVVGRGQPVDPGSSSRRRRSRSAAAARGPRSEPEEKQPRPRGLTASRPPDTGPGRGGQLLCRGWWGNPAGRRGASLARSLADDRARGPPTCGCYPPAARPRFPASTAAVPAME